MKDERARKLSCFWRNTPNVKLRAYSRLIETRPDPQSATISLA